jgi:hypothetical protein
MNSFPSILCSLFKKYIIQYASFKLSGWVVSRNDVFHLWGFNVVVDRRCIVSERNKRFNTPGFNV